MREIEIGATVREIAGTTGDRRPRARAVLLGGYFGTWARAEDVWSLPLDPTVMRSVDLTFGCGMIAVLPPGVCGVTVTAGIMAFLADETAGQCGPCVYGLRAIGDATARVAAGRVESGDLDRIERLTTQTAGRGACHHPDGAVQLMASALSVFGEEFARHARTGRCAITGSRVEAA